MKVFRILSFFLIAGFIFGCGGGSGKATLEGTVRVDLTTAEEDAFDLEGIQVFFPGTPWNSWTDKEGKFRIPEIDPGTYELVIKLSGFETYRRENIQISSGGKITLLPITLIKLEHGFETGKVLGTVEVEDADDFGDVQVGVDNTPFAIFTEPDGAYAFPRIPSGTYSLSFSKPGYKSIENIPVSVEPGEIVSIPKVFLEVGELLSFAPDGSIKGKILLQDTSAGLEGTLVSIPETNSLALTGLDGEFMVDDLPDGKYTLLAVRQGYVTGKFGPVVVESGKGVIVPDLTLKLPAPEEIIPGLISGLVQIYE